MNKVICGDCLEVMRGMEDNSVDAIVTDPPYGLKFMGKKWDYAVPSAEVWAECLRVLKHGGHLLCFGGTRTYHRVVCNIEDGGFEIRDTVAWVHGQGFPKSLNIGAAVNKLETKEWSAMWEGWGTALKPAFEPICLARKPLSEKNVALNCLKWGTGGLNIDGCRIGTEKINCHDAPKGTFAGGEAGRGSDTESYKDHDGRFPSNFIHDGSDEVVELFPETSGNCNGEARFGYHRERGKSRCKGAEYGHETLITFGDSGSAARFFYCAKASKKDRDEGCEGLEECDGGHYAQDEWSRQNMGNTPDAKRQPCRNNHPTVKPTTLMRYLCRLITPPNGIILDPFMGSGSTGKAAALEGFRFIGIELDPHYHQIATARIRWAENQKSAMPQQTTLFDTEV